jgi:C4-type Zn-finger protein
MPLEQLPIDELERHIAGHVALPGCPFCGNHPILHSSVNENPVFGDVPVFQSRLSCTNFKCNASMIANERSRDEAQKRVIEQWKRRAA